MTTCSLTCSLTVAVDPKVMALLSSVGESLQVADMDAAAAAVVDRIVQPGKLLSVERDENGQPVVRLQPMAELALLDVRAIARSAALDAATKQRKAAAVMALAGF